MEMNANYGVERRRTDMSKVCIAGAGSWGLALALVLEKNGHEVTVWSALPKEIGVSAIGRRK